MQTTAASFRISNLSSRAGEINSTEGETVVLDGELLRARGGRVCRDAVAFRVQEMDFNAAVIRIRGKGGMRATLPISPPVQSLLADWMPDSGPVFPSCSGAALSPRQAQFRLASWCKRAGMRTVSPHSLRHAFAQRLLRRTGDLSIVQRALTHRSITSTVVYARAEDAALRAALGA